MGCFFCRRDADGQDRWWLEVLGKGNKKGLVPASAEMTTELRRYRGRAACLPCSQGTKTRRLCCLWANP